ncbi:phospholipase B-like 1 [Discoglossus pictus]
MKVELFGLVGVVILNVVVLQAEYQHATVYWIPETSEVLVKNILDKNGDAYGFYNDTMNSTGWAVLELRAGYGMRENTDINIMFVAGYLEGYLTAHHMRDHYENMYPQLITNEEVSSAIRDFLGKQDRWIREKIQSNHNKPYWRHAGLIVSQLDGLYGGAVESAKRRSAMALSYFEVQFLNAVGDLLDLVPMMFPDEGLDWHSINVARRNKYGWTVGHCSALIKVLPGYENVLFGHSSWFTYAAMMRIYKHININIKDPDCHLNKMSFSSYPGFLESLDDFYILSSGLVVLQTTNSVYNRSLFKEVVPEAVLAWQRVRIANMMANNGSTWGHIVSKYNSGTYNNQYMILDMNKVTFMQGISDGALYIVEQIPTLVLYSDQTDILRMGYWASYNVPFHERIYNLSGYPGIVTQFGRDMSYNMCPRAKIFRRDEGKVKDMESLKYILRYNNYRNEPFAGKDPCKTICCREDLNAMIPLPLGCYDTKVSDVYMALRFQAYVISGPTTDDGLPPFKWKNFNGTVHQGMPETFNFSFILMEPTL